MDPATLSRLSEPNITVFHCERCCASVTLPPGTGIHCHLVPGCTCGVDAARLRATFLDGADGVLVLGCLGHSCCLPSRDVDAFQHIHESALALHRLGVDPARFQRTWLTSSEAARAPALIAAFRRRVIALGPRFEARAPRPDQAPTPVTASARG